jgi:hypothetical protein
MLKESYEINKFITIYYKVILIIFLGYLVYFYLFLEKLSLQVN